MSLSHACSFPSCSAQREKEAVADIGCLLNTLGRVPERRKARGKFYPLVFILAASLVAVLGGARTFQAITDQVRDFPQDLLKVLGGRWCYFGRRYRTPSERTIRNVFRGVDAEQLDQIMGAWLRVHARRSGGDVLSLAIDGKTLRGVRLDGGLHFTLFSAVIHREGVTVAQVAVPTETKEITQVDALLDQVEAGDKEQVIITMDAAHTQRETAEYLAGNRGFDYVMTIKGNQPTLLKSVFETVSPLLQNTPHYHVAEKGHGRISEWTTWITDSTGIDFPHARQAGCVRRDVFALDGVRIRREYAWVITSRAEEKMTTADFHDHVRGHWSIENKSHYVRDTTWREDAHIIVNQNAARAIATLRNISASLLRFHDHNNISRATQWVCRKPARALTILAT